MATQKAENGTKAVEEKKPDAAMMKRGERQVAKVGETRIAKYDPTDGDGWQIRDTGDERMYWLKEEGSVIQGIAIGTSSFEDERGDTRLFVKCQLTEETIGVGSKTGETGGAPMRCGKGDIVFIGMTHGLMDLYSEVTESRRLLEVAVKAKKKVAIGGGQTVWRYAYAVKPTKQMKIERFSDRKNVESEFSGDDGVPF